MDYEDAESNPELADEIGEIIRAHNERHKKESPTEDVPPQEPTPNERYPEITHYEDKG